MQIGPKHHHHGQQEPSGSLQALCVEDDAEHHGGRVWRRREIGVRGCRKSRVKQAGGQNGNADRERRGAAAEADRCEISGDDSATRNDRQCEAGISRVLKHDAGDHVPEPGEIIPLSVAERE
ncbi:hypothetical protein chiPu_0032823 [Chiloscyllium punctatum]|uniref:Uncharacterized protein n=1 Tax=Chiloscyllium punctatum TaxID=137246 RepID=A0A401U0Q2_CHIPU|nr:hypothetical protein [Chiloscyllium punctatum]